MLLLNEVSVLSECLRGKAPRTFIKGDDANRMIRIIEPELMLSDELPSNEHPGIYIAVYLVDSEGLILSFRHTQEDVYGLKSILVGGWCVSINENVSAERSLEMNAVEIFTTNFAPEGAMTCKLAGVYINKLIPEDVKRIGVIYECTVGALQKVKFLGNSFFDPIALRKDEAFMQSTKYDHWSSQVVFSMCK